MSRRAAALGFVLLWMGGQHLTAIEVERVVIDDKFPGAYQVEVADVNGDRKPDVIAVGGGTCAWYENPSWTKRVVSDPKQTPGIISSATADLDGDGKAEIAIAYEFGMNEPTKGKLVLATQAGNEKWTFSPMDDMTIGSIHRLRWGDLNGDKQPDLVVAPLFGTDAKPPTFDQDGARIQVFHPHGQAVRDGWDHYFEAKSTGRPVIHAIEVIDADGDGRSEILTASNLGVAITGAQSTDAAGFGLRPWRNLVAGAPGAAPKRGSSEVHLGRLRDGRRFLVTIEPWHGTEVAVYLGEKAGQLDFGARTIIDDTLAEGHALWVADVDGDGDTEVFAGHRGADHRVSMYDFDGKAWNRTVIDRAIAAQDLRGGDLDGDGTPDVVAVGGSTHNVVWYRPIRK